MSVENGKKLVQEDDGIHIDENIIDILTIFDGSRNSRRWTGSRGLVLGIVESTSHVLDVADKSHLCSQCDGIEERKKNGACSMLECLYWYIRHENNCFTYHGGSAQVGIICKKFSLLLQNIRAKALRMAVEQLCTFFIKKIKF